MRRPVTSLALGCVLLLVGCGGGTTVSPLPETVIGKLPKAPTVSLAKGNPAAGKKLFTAQGCTGCHTYAPAGSKAAVGPDLDKLAQYAKQANEGSLEQFTYDSIVNPSKYVQPGFKDVMPKSFASLKKQQLADLVAFLTKKS
jgi:cytochrome c2